MYTGMLPGLAPSWSQIVQIRISFRSRSGCWPILGFFFIYLVLQACISFYSVLDKSGA